MVSTIGRVLLFRFNFCAFCLGRLAHDPDRKPMDPLQTLKLSLSAKPRETVVSIEEDGFKAPLNI